MIAAGLLDILDREPADSSAAFRVLRVPDRPSYLVGKTAGGEPCLLVTTTGTGRKLPLFLASIHASFSVPCHVTEPYGPARTETLTVIRCTSAADEVRAYFVGLLDFLMDLLGPSPSLAETVDAVERLVELFQKLRRPSKTTVLGLAGELVFILAARDARAAVEAWRVDPGETFDFAYDELRLDVKATSGTERVHRLSYEQANPPEGTTGILASLFIHPTAGGTSLSQLLGMIEEHLSDPVAVGRLRLVVASSLGEELPNCLGWTFDLARASASLTLFDLRGVPAIRGPLSAGISGVRFTSDLTRCEVISAEALSHLSHRSNRVLPGRP